MITYIHLHFSPNSPQTHPPLPILSQLCSLWFCFVYNPWDPICAAHILKGVGPFTGYWSLYQGLPPQRKWTLAPAEAISCHQLPRAGGGEAHGPLRPPCLNVDWLDLVQVSPGQPWLLCVRECRGPVVSRRHCPPQQF